MSITHLQQLLADYLQTQDETPIIQLFQQLQAQTAQEKNDLLVSDNPQETPSILVRNAPNENPTVNLLFEDQEHVDRAASEASNTFALQDLVASHQTAAVAAPGATQTLDMNRLNAANPQTTKTKQFINAPPRPSNPQQPSLQTDLAHYKKLGLLGKGAMGAVWRILDTRLHRALALKTLHADLAKDSEERESFIEEAQITAQLQHPGILPVHELGLMPDGNLYFTMREVEGRTFAEVMKGVHQASEDGVWRSSNDGWSFRRLLTAFQSICETIAYAHSKGVVHCDLKPANIMIGEFGEVLVVDWGIAKLIPQKQFLQDHPKGKRVQSNRSLTYGDLQPANAIIGTPTHMSPEQASGHLHLVDERSDIYSLGAILYQILTGRNAYRGSSLEIIDKKCQQDPPTIRETMLNEEDERLLQFGIQPPPSAYLKQRAVPDELVQICKKAMQRQRSARYQRATDLAMAIQSWLDGARRQEKALSVVEDSERAARQMTQLRQESLRDWRKAEELLSQHGVQCSEAWQLWEQAKQKQEQAEEWKEESAQLLHGALIHFPDMIETHRRFIETEYHDYLQAVLKNEKRIINKIERKLQAHIEQLPTEEQKHWERKRQTDLASLYALQKRRGSFIGRKKQQNDVIQTLEQTKLVSLVGPAGVGKTHLALEVANQWREHNQSEILFCDASLARDEISFVKVVGETLGLTMLAAHPLKQVATELTSRGSLLLVLDNLEQLIHIAAPVLQDWLKQTTNCKVLLTSRVHLGIQEEHIFRLHPMSLLEALELFMERAQEQLPELTLNDSNRTIIASIAKQLDKLPLAIELAAARVSMLSLQEIDTRLSASFALLRSRLRDKEQRALTGALDWSWDLLGDWDKSALAQCSVFRNGFDLVAAESIIDLSHWADTYQILDVLEALCDDNLLLRQRQEDGSYRYTILNSIHRYAQQKLDGDEPNDEAIRKQAPVKHAEYFAELFCQQHPQTSVIATELDNFIAAAHQGESAAATTCCRAAVKILHKNGPIALAVELTTSLLQRQNFTPQDRLIIQLERASCLHASGQMDAARADIKVVFEQLQESNNPHLATQQQQECRANAFFVLGRLDYVQAKYNESSRHFSQALTLYQQLHNRTGEAKTRRSLARIDLIKGNTQLALEGYESILPFTETHELNEQKGLLLGDLGIIYHQLGEIDKAIKTFVDSLQIKRLFANQADEASTMVNLANIYLRNSESSKALEKYGKALQLYKKIGNVNMQAVVLGNIGNVLEHQGEYTKALESFKKGLTIAKTIGNRRSEGKCLSYIGSLYQNLGDFQQALTYLQQAAAIHEEIHNKSGQGIGYGNVGDVLYQLGRDEEAKNMFLTSIAILKESDRVVPVACFQGSMALLLAQQGLMAEATSLLDQAEAQLQPIPVEYSKFLCKKGLVALLAENLKEAEKHLAQARKIAADFPKKGEQGLRRWMSKLQDLLDAYPSKQR